MAGTVVIEYLGARAFTRAIASEAVAAKAAGGERGGRIHSIEVVAGECVAPDDKRTCNCFKLRERGEAEAERATWLTEAATADTTLAADSKLGSDTEPAAALIKDALEIALLMATAAIDGLADAGDSGRGGNVGATSVFMGVAACAPSAETEKPSSSRD